MTLHASDFPPTVRATRPSGDVTFLSTGCTSDLRSSSDAKAAEYWQTSGALPRRPHAWFGDGPKPAMQIVFDFDDVDQRQRLQHPRRRAGPYGPPGG